MTGRSQCASACGRTGRGSTSATGLQGGGVVLHDETAGKRHACAISARAAPTPRVGPVGSPAVISSRRSGALMQLAAVATGCWLVSACSHAGSNSPGVTAGRSPSVSVSTTALSAPPSRGESVVRSLVPAGADRYGWVQATARKILATYYPAGSHNYIGGGAVAPTDEIIMIKMHGVFDHSALAGAPSTASLALTFYDATKTTRLPMIQYWDGDAPDLGVGVDPGITSRDQAARRWDMRLIGTPTVRAI